MSRDSEKEIRKFGGGFTAVESMFRGSASITSYETAYLSSRTTQDIFDKGRIFAERRADNMQLGNSLLLNYKLLIFNNLI